MPVIDAFKKTLNFLDKLKSENFIEDYVLIGGLALSAWIKPRTTKDVDLIVALSPKAKWGTLASNFEERFQRRVVIEKGSKKTNIKEKISFMLRGIEVDLISTKGFALAEEALRKALRVKVFGKDVKVVSPEYLTLLKLLPLSEQDSVDIKKLLKVVNYRKLTSLAKKYFLDDRLKPLLPKHKE